MNIFSFVSSPIFPLGFCKRSLAVGLLVCAQSSPASSVFINEFHYDNLGTDTGEAIEIAGPAGQNLADWELVLYNGNNGTAYRTWVIQGVIEDQQNGFGTVVVPFSDNKFQNGSPDAIALVDSGKQVLQFLSYEGQFTAIDGPASGMTSMDIGVAEGDDTTKGFSLQLTGSGYRADDFVWSHPQPNTFGAVNSGQTFVPVPAALPLLLSGIAGMGFFFRRRGHV